MSKILAFAGSLRKGSVNKKLVKYAALELKKLGHEVTFVDLADYPLPIYNQDVTLAEFPKEAELLSKLMMDNPVWLIASPEYNYSVTACIKNLIDWISRTPNNEPNIAAFTGRVIGLISASPSNFGGFRSLRHLRDILTALGSMVIPSQTCVANAFAVLDEEGNLNDPNSKKALDITLKQLTKMAEKLT